MEPSAKKPKTRTPTLADMCSVLGTVEYSSMRKNKKGMNMVYFKFPDGRGLRFQLCATNDPHYAPYGLTLYLPDATDGEREEKYRTTNRKNFLIALTEADIPLLQAWHEHNIQTGIRNKAEWFKNASDDIIRSRYTPLIVPSKEGPAIRTKVNTDTVTILEYDPENNELKPIPARELENKELSCVPMCEAGSFWFQSHNWGMTIVCTHIIKTPTSSLSMPFCWHNDCVPRIVAEERLVPYAMPPVSPSSHSSHRTADGTLVFAEDGKKQQKQESSVLLMD